MDLDQLIKLLRDLAPDTVEVIDLIRKPGQVHKTKDVRIGAVSPPMPFRSHTLFSPDVFNLHVRMTKTGG